MGQSPSSVRSKRGRQRSFRSFTRRNKLNKSGLSHTFSMPPSDEYHELMNINTATEEQLMTLPGVSRQLAREIVRHRQMIGRFKRVDDLALVSGIGAEKLELLRPEICVKKQVSRASSCTQSLDSIRFTPESKDSKLCSVNSSSVFQLQCVPGLNQELAANIVDHRNKKGPFKSLDDLIKVRGMDIVRLSTVKQHLTLERRKCESVQNLNNSLSINGSNGYTNSTPISLNGSVNGVLSMPRTPHRKSLSMPTKFPMMMTLPNGFANAPVNDILDLLSAYSHRPIVEEVFTYERKGVPCCRIATWNLHQLSVDKIMNPGVREVVCRTILENKLSLIAIQDILDEAALKITIDELNSPSLRRVKEWKANSCRWDYCISGKIGSQHLGFIFDTSTKGITIEDIGLDQLCLLSKTSGASAVRRFVDELTGLASERYLAAPQARASANEEQLWQVLQSVEEFLLRVTNAVHREVRHEIVTAILDKLYTLISDPESDACPAASAVLAVLAAADSEAGLRAARWLVQQRGAGPAGAGLRAALACLYRWVYEWRATPALGDWIMAYIKALEENERFDILIEVSVDNLGRFFLALDNPEALRQPVADVIFHILASLRESTEALDRISPYVGRVLTNLAADSGQWSRQLLQHVVDILTAMIDCLVRSFHGEAQEMFKDKYADLTQCLERHMASRGCQFLTLPPWRVTRSRKVCLPTAHAHAPTRKVGLLNLGNTCYVNSVMQALLLTRQFSTNVVMKMHTAPYWSKMGVLFATMMHSVSTKLNPEDFFTAVRPPFFLTDTQHDSSEFLGYLFELLQSYEHRSDVGFDYTRPPVLTGSRTRAALPPLGQASPTPHSSSDTEPAAESSSNRRSVSPRPGGSSSAGSSSCGQKRASPEHEPRAPKKRMRMTESAFLRRDSFVDSMFGGVLLTRVECTECHSSSLSRDVFRDLQLAFPEKADGKRHTVQSLLEFYCSKESLTDDNRYECRDCGGLRNAERSVLIETTPKYLILVLKNFKFEPKLQVQRKLMHQMFHNTTVTLPTVRSQAEHATYALYAAVIHAGTTLDSGHYYTLASDNGQWHMYNDEIVTAAEETHLGALSRSSTPYILFYRRNDIVEGPPPSLEELPPKLQESVMSHNKLYVDTVREICITRP